MPTAPETAAFATVPDNWAGSNIRRERREAEKKLLLCAARAHVSMGGVLDGLALIDDAARLGGDMARKGGRWGGDGDAGAGAARLLSNEEASELVEELCVNGREIGLRAALRLRERLAEQVRCSMNDLARSDVASDGIMRPSYLSHCISCARAKIALVCAV